jgi:hypothetical protein
MTPTEYREPEVGELLVAHSAYFQRLPSLQSLREAGRNCASQPVGTGHLDVDLVLPDDAPPATVLVGVFADNVPQRGPVAFGGSANTRSGRLTVHGVPEGNWTVIAIADHGGRITGGPAFTVGTASAALTPFDPPDVTVRLRRPALTDPPIAITLASRPTPSSRQQFATQRPHLRAVA